MNLTSALLLFIVFLCSCKEGRKGNIPGRSAESQDSATMHIQVPDQYCYFYSNGKDTFHMKIEVFPNVVSGELVYDFNEKDQNTGTIDGVMSGDTLRADYTFSSEGVLSTRQVIFLISDSVAAEGTGEMEEVNHSQVFKKDAVINFDSGVRMLRVSCKMLDRHP